MTMESTDILVLNKKLKTKQKKKIFIWRVKPRPDRQKRPHDSSAKTYPLFQLLWESAVGYKTEK